MENNKEFMILAFVSVIIVIALFLASPVRKEDHGALIYVETDTNPDCENPPCWAPYERKGCWDIVNITTRNWEGMPYPYEEITWGTYCDRFEVTCTYFEGDICDNITWKEEIEVSHIGERGFVEI